MGAVKVVETDTGWNDLIKSLNIANGKVLNVGVLDPGASHPSGSTVGAVALAHEFGTSRNPENSFIRATFDANAGTYASIFKEEFADLDIAVALTKLGKIMVQNIKFRIASIPLIDTRTLVQSIGFEIK